MTPACSLCGKPNRGKNPFFCPACMASWFGPVRGRQNEVPARRHGEEKEEVKLFDYSLCDTLAWLRKHPDNSIQMHVTSVPYWGLRDYGFAGQIGQEDTMAEHIQVMVDIFSEAKRTLHPFGTTWLNYGDAWAQAGKRMTEDRPSRREEHVKNSERAQRLGYKTDAYNYEGWDRATGTAQGSGLEPKQKLFLPHRVAIALQDSGWWVRDDLPVEAHPTEIVWRKPNAKPEPNRLKPCRTHEYVFLLAKNPRYYYDDAAITEPSGARLRSVWSINNVGTSDNHTATFPEELARRCILLGSNAWSCSSCGMPYQPVYEELVDSAWRKACGANSSGSYEGVNLKDYSSTLAETPGDVKRRILAGLAQRRHVDDVPNCDCSGADRAPSVVCDFFGGTATAGVVAIKHGRRFVGCEGSPVYHKIGLDRLAAANKNMPASEHRAGQLSLLEGI